jgi:hypothetical protein
MHGSIACEGPVSDSPHYNIWLQYPPADSALVQSASSLIQCFCVGTNHAKGLNSSMYDLANYDSAEKCGVKVD